MSSPSTFRHMMQFSSCAGDSKFVPILMFLGSEWSEVPGEPAQPLCSHPGAADQQGFSLFSASGLLCATY